MKKTELKKDTVESDKLHVGIELELIAEGQYGHNEDACRDNQWDYINGLSAIEIMVDYMGIPRSQANSIDQYFDTDKWVRDYMDDWTCDGDCGSSDIDRDDIAYDLKKLTGNNSFKVVDDSSINTRDGAGAEVCWNYFASKETIKDNQKIMEWLVDRDFKFDTSCGLHINLNNYLEVPETTIPTEQLDFLFYLVGPSRRENRFCNKYGVSSTAKYSMIYHQGDRLEFRFFSPTLNAEKLNNYVSLANLVYKRLAGKQCKLNSKLTKYFTDKMTKAGHSTETIIQVINQINSIKEVTNV